MPTITFSLKDLSKLVGKRLTIEQFEQLAMKIKGEVDGYDADTDEVTLALGDTNQAWLWSVEGVAIALKGMLGKEKGIPKLKVQKSNYVVHVATNLAKIRPFFKGFVARGVTITEPMLKQMIQLQEKLSENLGRKRSTLGMGIYNLAQVKFPLSYKAVDPKKHSFVPLGMDKKIKLHSLTTAHPKGRAYAHLLKGKSMYPTLFDKQGDILCVQPITNAEGCGRVEVGNNDLFVEATGTDEKIVDLGLMIFAHALSERGYTLYNVDIKKGSSKKQSISLKTDTMRINYAHIEEMLGISLKDKEVRSLLEAARYDVDKQKVSIPSFRKDIMHEVDVIEDVAIQYGYEKLPTWEPEHYTVGAEAPIEKLARQVREYLVGFGFQETFSNILSSKQVLVDNMEIKSAAHLINIKEYMSESYSCPRSQILPIILQILAKNRHVEYPQQIFEEGEVAYLSGKTIHEERHIAFASAGSGTVTSALQMVHSMLRLLDVAYTIEEHDHPTFIEGRCAVIMQGKSQLGIVGEIHPKVLENFDLEVPIIAAELNLSHIHEE